jgi:hypothetical protein
MMQAALHLHRCGSHGPGCADGGVAFIETQINSGKSRAQVDQELVSLGVKPDDAVLRVYCVMANWPVGTS